MTDRRMDVWANAQTGLGGKNARQQFTTFVGRQPKEITELSNIYRFSGVMGRIIDMIPDSMFAKSFEVEGIKGEDVSLFEDELTRLGVQETLSDAVRWARLSGGSVVYMRISDGRPSTHPVDILNIRSIDQLIAFDASEVHVARWGEEHTSAYFRKPEVYSLSLPTGMLDVHASRVLHFDGVRATYRMARNNPRPGFGSSIIDQIFDAFEQYGTSHSYMSDAMSRHTQGLLKLNGLNELLRSNSEEGVQRLQERLQALISSLSVIGDMVIDKQDDYVVATRPITGIGEAADRGRLRLVAETGIPLSILFGETPGGLNAGGNSGDWAVFAKLIASEQRRITKTVRRFADLLFAARSCPVPRPKSIKIVWPSIIEMSEAERSQIDEASSRIRSSDLAAGVVTVAEVRDDPDVVARYGLDSGMISELETADPFAETDDGQPSDAPPPGADAVDQP